MSLGVSSSPLFLTGLDSIFGKLSCGKRSRAEEPFSNSLNEGLDVDGGIPKLEASERVALSAAARRRIGCCY